MKPRYWYGLQRNVNPLGFGCWQLAGTYFEDARPQGWQPIDRTTAVRLVRTALDRGIEFFDTAASYGNGLSESILGEAISVAGTRANTVVCTKIAITAAEENQLRLESSFIDKVTQSLLRLKTDYVDVLLLHNPSDRVDWGVFDREILDDLKSRGIIRSYGVSARGLQGARNVVEARFGDCIEWPFHALERRPARELFPKLGKASMNFIARSPLSRGLLTQSRVVHRQTGFAQDEYRSTLPGDWVDWTAHAARHLIHASPNVAVTALRFCLSFMEVSAVIPGIRQPAHLDDLLFSGSAGALPPDVLTKLERSLPECFPAWASD